MIVAFIAIQVMAFAMNDPTLIYVSITASVTFIIYVMMQFMTSSNYSGSRAAAVERLKATGSAIRDPNNRFNSAMGRTFGGMRGMANSVLGPESRIARGLYRSGLGSRPNDNVSIRVSDSFKPSPPPLPANDYESFRGSGSED